MIPPPQEATDIFSISDQVLADRLQFIEEIGFGNWGSVWLCRPKPDPPSSSGGPPRPNENKIAVKLVHRSKTSTTAARVRSLWNEMKVVRSLKHEPHPSIIPFYSFIITPSYALITMAFHPRLVPVEVSERHAKEWFRSLLSGIAFIHKRGVVHNDIKPANILLSSENVPVLVDFGFAERYDISDSTAFHSNLSYGTPEYLSPERARGMPHDTRKSDVWSLGITFFEILVGRTPFEHSEGEQFSTKEDLEKYWARTLKGKWVGSWKMSSGAEALLRRMISPNADLRCTAAEAMEDSYWAIELEKEKAGKSHKKAASVAHPASTSIAPLNAADVSKLIDQSLPWSPHSNSSLSTSRTTSTREKKTVDKENTTSPPPGLPSATMKEKRTSKRVEPKHARSHSQPKLYSESPKPRSKTNEAAGTPRMASVFSALSPIPQIRIAPTPINTPDTSLIFSASASIKGPVFSSPTANTSTSSFGRRTKKPTGPRESPTSSLSQKRAEALKKLAAREEALDNPPAVPEKDASPSVTVPRRRESKDKDSKDKNRRSRVFGVDLTSLSRNASTASNAAIREESKKTAAMLAPIPAAKRRVAPAAKDKENAPTAATRRPVSTVVKPTKSAAGKAKASPTSPSSPGEIKQDSVRDRMREWERERQRLRELARFESETERESEAERAEARVQRVEALRKEQAEEEKKRRVEEMMKELEEAREREKEKEKEKEREMEEVVEKEKERRRFNLPQIAVVSGDFEQAVESALPTPLSPLMEESFESRFLDDYTRSGNESSLNLLKQSLKMSIDGAVRLYKSSAALALGRAIGTEAINGDDDDGESRRSVSDRASWENDALVREAKSSLPVVRHAVRNEQLAQESQLDRMTIWIRSVEKVVEDARQNFNASTTAGPLPPLPVAPVSRPKLNASTNSKATNELSRSQRSNTSRVPRKILAANQIFVNEYESGMIDSAAPSPLASSFDLGTSSQNYSSSFAAAPRSPQEKSFANSTLPTIPSEDERSRVVPSVVVSTPAKSRARRATVVTMSPEPKAKPAQRPSLEVDTAITSSPSKRREKSRSQNDLSHLGRTITPVTQLEFEIERLSKPTPPANTRLSAVIDPSLFVRPSTPGMKLSEFDDSIVMKRSLGYDDLTSSPLHVDPYPARPQSHMVPALDTPAKKQVESVYDRFLMSTTGVKRNGRGYQSDNFGVTSHTAQPKGTLSKGFFNTTSRRPMPPPVSSEDWRNLPTDEFGSIGSSQSPRVGPSAGAIKSEGVSKFRTALRTIVNGKR
ncbi:hypothetical protein BXZ70DRAFT_631704 [Cristinia sonorae]|uniref:Protein kinase domain-containing protein n=1 Tax=Cristinia sonorae TaxID=1940300 RepID=A0A8K0UEM9_9AGAR|nr:hypothetical protein BXZ70DRAFT_631704 [Cristinia sonorae]